MDSVERRGKGGKEGFLRDQHENTEIYVILCIIRKFVPSRRSLKSEIIQMAKKPKIIATIAATPPFGARE